MKWFKWESAKDKKIKELEARILELEAQVRYGKRRRNNKKNSKA